MAYIPLPGPEETRYQQGDGLNFAVGVVEQISEHRVILADHEGQLKSVSGLVAAVQSSLSAWQNVAIGIAGAIGVAIAILAGFQVASFAEIGTAKSDAKLQIDGTNAKIDRMDGRLQTIESAQRTLPAEISQQLINMAAALSATRQLPAPAPDKKK